ncbi:PREDICTED: alpha- and beta-fibrinogenase OhS1-like [Gekko japonicus]|uniref:Alpha- and beta-fibrinogenase OhS1-like n=1 Tax=Gekko japonicus TaxID=146911 RepID=A0ABM1KW80_GEKJA|nr:PREDICTED: alpha- and beta-fibrinogenase OhS1-like [Gekko japonicus]
MSTVPTLLSILVLLLDSTVSPYRDRIIGGCECPEDEHPWLVLLYNLTLPYCAGVLIDLNWVVTAAHCCPKSSEIVVIRLGEHNLSESSGNEQMRTSAETIVFDPDVDCANECENDIMLIKLNTAADRTAYVAPLSLATSPPSLGTSCTVMGWGAVTSPEETFPDVPHCVNITILESQSCKDEFPCVVPENILCAGVLEGGKDSCRGDSGGPLICEDTLQGIVSLGGNPCGQPNLPGVYTKISQYASWIQENIGGSDNGAKS